MALLPFLPSIPGESLTSYLNRVAQAHFCLGLYPFLEMIELPRQALMAPRIETLSRLSDLLGLSVDELGRMTFQAKPGRMRIIAGEAVHPEFTAMTTTSFCPQCLLDDSAPNSPSQGIRVGRVSWQIEPLRACSIHDVVLVRYPVRIFSEGLQVMADVAPSDDELNRLAASATHVSPSGLQCYIENRLRGRKGPAWLDSQPLDLAARACEMLGVILTSSGQSGLRSIGASAWHNAGDAGFHVASKGADGIRASLEQYVACIPENERRGGPQHALGHLYKWLQFNRNAKPFGPIRDVVREFILDVFPIPVNTELFGERVDRQRVHSAYSLSKMSTLHVKTIARAVVLAGLADGDPSRVQAHLVFDAVEGEALARRLETALTGAELERYLNCNRVQVQQLVRGGVIPRIIDGNAAVGALKGVALADADAFLERLLAQATLVEIASPEVVDLVTAATIARWPVVDIVNGLLSGIFNRVEMVEPALKFKGVLVDPEEVRMMLSRNKAAGRVGIEEAAALIGMTLQGVNALLKLPRDDGSPFIKTHEEKNAKGKTVRLFDRAEILAFRRGHTSLKEIAKASECSLKTMKLKMDAQGALPLTPRREIGSIWYRRCDV